MAIYFIPNALSDGLKMGDRKVVPNADLLVPLKKSTEFIQQSVYKKTGFLIYFKSQQNLVNLTFMKDSYPGKMTKTPKIFVEKLLFILLPKMGTKNFENLS